MRLLSLCFVTLMLFSACQPQDVSTDDGIIIQVRATVATDVKPDTAIELEFSSPLPTGVNLRDYIVVTPDIDGELTLATDGLSATFIPEPGWEPEMSYRITVADGVALANGDHFASAEWQFQTQGWTDPAIQLANTGTVKGWGLTIDSSGNVFVVGQVLGADEFAGLSTAYSEQGVVQKFSPTGELLWSKLIDPGYHSAGFDIHVSNRDVLTVLIRGVSDQTRVYQLDTDGEMLSGSPWIITADDASVWLDAVEMRVADSGEVYLYGQTQGSIDGVQSGHLFLMKYTSGGQRAWVKQFDTVSQSPSDYLMWDMVLDNAGSIYLDISSAKSLLGSEPIWDGTTAVPNGVVVKFDADGNLSWINRFGHNDITLSSLAIQTNEQGDVLAAFEFYNAPAGAELNGTALNASDGMVLVRYNQDGVHQSTTVYANNGGWTGVTDMQLTTDGTLIGVGFYYNEVTNPAQNWLTEWDAQGNLYRERFQSDLFADYYAALAIDPWGRLFMVATEDNGLLLRQLSFD
ncbi:Ig-like domain-containing protein [Gynuella sunshinyii]|nr:Ig-like domain-containing protein [Gynuella sunshinyii]